MSKTIKHGKAAMIEEKHCDINDNRYLNERELSKIIGRSIPALQRDRYRRIGPPYYKIGKNVRYLWKDVRGYLESKRVETDY